MCWIRAALLGLLLAACTPAVSIQSGQQASVTTKQGQEPRLGIAATTNVGAIMYTEYNYTVTTAIRLLDAVNDTFGLGARVQAPIGAVLYEASVSGRIAYCTVRAAYTEPLSAVASRSVCFFDNNQDGRLDEYWITGTLQSTSRSISPVIYKLTQTTSDVAGGLKKELLYQGIQADTLRISYREYVDNMARPAFQQDLTYTMKKAQPTTVVFQNVRMEVFSADNSEISYKILQGF